MSGWVQGRNQKGAWVFRKPLTLRENSIFFYICIAQKSFFTAQWPPHGNFSGSAPGWVGECVQVSYVAEKKVSLSCFALFWKLVSSFLCLLKHKKWGGLLAFDISTNEKVPLLARSLQMVPCLTLHLDFTLYHSWSIQDALLLWREIYATW